MSTIIIAVILILIIISICLILVSINNRHRQKATTELLTRFCKVETENNLSFSRQEFLENSLIGLDEIQRKLLILKKIGEDKYDSLLLDLNEVKNCSKQKIYKKINIGTTKKENFENHIEKIALTIDFISNRQPVQIIFFEPMSDHLLKMAELDQKAKDWETILNKLVHTRMKKIA